MLETSSNILLLSQSKDIEVLDSMFKIRVSSLGVDLCSLITLRGLLCFKIPPREAKNSFIPKKAYFSCAIDSVVELFHIDIQRSLQNLELPTENAA